MPVDSIQRTSNNDLAAMVQDLIHKNDIDHLQINNSLGKIAEQQGINTDQIKENETSLKGNGKEGLNSIMNGMRKTVDRMEKILWLILSSFVVGIIGAILTSILI